jgi:hypothetical protein
MSSVRRASSSLSKLFSRRRRVAAHRPRKAMQAERLELRQLMAADFNPYHNPVYAQDVNHDFQVSPLDALLIINDLNASGPRALPMGAAQTTAQGEGEQQSYPDVNGDGYLSPIDVLSVINHLNAQGAGPIVVKFKSELIGEDGNPLVPTSGTGTTADPFVYTVNKDQRVAYAVSLKDNRPQNQYPTDYPLGVFSTHLDIAFDPSKVALGFSEVQSVSILPTSPTTTAGMNVKITVPGLGTTGNINLVKPGAPNNTTDPSLYRSLNAARIQDALNLLAGAAAGEIDHQEITVGFSGDTYNIKFAGSFVGKDVGTISVAVVNGAATIGPVTTTFDALAASTADKVAMDAALNFNALYAPETENAGDPRKYELYVPVDATHASIVRAGGRATGDYSTIDGDSTDYDPANYPDADGFQRFLQPWFVAANATASGSPITFSLNPPGIPDDNEFDGKSETLVIGAVLNSNPQVSREMIDYGAPIKLIIRADVTANPDTPNTTPSTIVNEGSPEVVIDVLANDTNNNGQPASKFIVAVGAPGNTGPFATSQGSVRIDAGVIKYTPNTNAFGADSFTYYLSDSAGGTVKDQSTVTLQLNEINDNPVANADPGLSVLEDIGTVLNLLANDTTGVDPAGTPPTGDLLQYAPLNNPSWVLPAHGTLSLAAGQLTYTPAQDYNGPDSFTYVLADGRNGTATAVASLTVTAVNDVPSFTVGGTQTALEDANTQTIANFIATKSAGPADESSQTLTFNVSNVTNSSLFSTAPSIASDGTLTFKPALNQFGSSTVTVSVSDSGGTANGGVNTSATQTFTIDITPVNDAPTFTVPASTTSQEDTGLRTVNLATAIQLEPVGSPATAQVGTFEIVSVSNPTLFSTAPAIAANGTLTYQAGPDKFGTATVTVRLHDNGGTASGGVDVSTDKTFDIVISPANDPPVVTNETLNVPDGSNDLVLDVLANDTIGPDVGETLTISAFTTSNLPANVSVSRSADLKTFLITTLPGTFSVPNGTINYTVSDGNGGTAPGIATLVFIPSRLPLGTDDVVSGVTEDQVAPTNIANLLTNDRGVDFQTNGSASLRITGLSLTDDDPAAATWATSVTAADGTVISISDLVGGNGTQVEFKPGLDVFGTYTFYYRLDDVVNQASPKYEGPDVAKVTVTIAGDNDAPRLTLNSTADTHLEDAGLVTLAGVASAFAGPATGTPETTNGFDSVSTVVTGNTNTGLFSVQPTVAANGTLTYTTAPNANGTAVLTLVARDSFGLESAPLTFTIDLTAVNDAPTYIVGGPVTVLEDSAAYSQAWATNVSTGAANESQTLTFSVTNSNNPLFLVQPSIDPSGVLSFTPAANANGSATVTVNLTDSGDTANGGVNAAVTKTFTINLTAVNDIPTFDPIANPVQTVFEDAGPQSVGTFATGMTAGPTTGDVSEVASQTLSFVVTNDNSALFLVQPTINATTGLLTYTPAANANGTANVTVRLKDNGLTANGGVDTSAPQTFTINVTAVNDVPTYTSGPSPVTVLEDSAAFSQAWATNVSPGPSNESGQAVAFTVTNSNNALFSVQPAISPSGLLTFALAANANTSAGPVTITVSAKDNGGTAGGGVDTVPDRTFTLNVTPVNDVPSFTLTNPNQVINEDAGAQTATVATSISAGPSNESGQTVDFQVTNSNPSLFTASGQPAINAAGVLTYTPAANANTLSGPVTVTVRLHDNGGTTNSGVDLSAAQTFNITINPVNDAPMANPDGPFDIFKTIASSQPFNLVANDSIAPDVGETLTITSATIAPAPTSVPGLGSPSIANVQVVITNAAGVPTPNGQFIVLKNPDQFYGKVVVNYTITDNVTGGLTSSSTATFNVLNFLPGFISGVVWADIDNDGIVDENQPPLTAERRIAGVEVFLTGTTMFGAPYSLSTTTNARGEYSFNDSSLPLGGIIPGTYTISTNGVELFTDGKDVIGQVNGATVASNGTNSFSLTFGQTGATVTNLNFGVLGLQSQFVNIRDHLASSTSEGVVFGLNVGASTPDGQQYWSALYDGWAGWHDLKITMSTDLKSATVTAVNASGQLYSRTLSLVTDYTDMRVMGRDGNNVVVRLVGNAIDGANPFFTSSNLLSSNMPGPQGEAMYAGGEGADYAAAADAVYADEAWA